VGWVQGTLGGGEKKCISGMRYDGEHKKGQLSTEIFLKGGLVGKG